MMLNVVYDPFPTRKIPFFTLFILSRASDNTTSQNIGGRMHGPSPTSYFLGGPSPSPPLGLRPWEWTPLEIRLLPKNNESAFCRLLKTDLHVSPWLGWWRLSLDFLKGRLINE